MTWLIILIVLFVAADIAFVIYVLIKRKKRTLDASTIKTVHQNWPQITSRLDQDPSGAVMDADKLLAYVLDKMGYSGMMADKLKAAGSSFSDLDGLWSAHKLRNKVVHEVNIVITPKDSRRAIKSFERALKDLKAF
jgi:rhodanese-related sulfurtransferase